MIPLLLSLLLDAGAAAPDRYPRMADVALPETGPVRLRVPPELRSPHDPADATDLLLVDAEGRVVPITRLSTSSPPLRVPPSPELRVVPTTERDVWTVEVRERPIDALEVRPSATPGAATVTVLTRDATGGGWDTVAEALIWRTEHGEQLHVPLGAPTLGTLRLSVQWHTEPQSGSPRIAGLRHRSPMGPEDTVRVPIKGWVHQENGLARYPFSLPSAWPISSVRLETDAPLFERRGSVVPLGDPPLPGEAPGWELHLGVSQTLRRVQLGDARVDHVTLPGPLEPADQLAVLVETGGRAPLPITAVTVALPGAELLAQDAGPGPHTLYGGAPPGTSPTFDLAAATPELARLAPAPVTPGEVVANPNYLPPEVRAGLVQPGVPISTRRQRWVHQVTGPPGLVRIPLTTAVFGGARSDLGDLRLLDAEDRQIPYVLRRRGRDHSLGDLAFTRAEHGSISTLEIALPEPSAPVSSVTLTTPATVFQRRITLARPDRGALTPLRTAQWTGSTGLPRLTLDLGRVVGDTLAVQIANGDDPPLPIDGVEVTWPAWELWATLPPEGARLVYGDPRLTAPSHDLRLLRDEIRHRVAKEASLGPATALTPPPPPLRDRLLVLAGLAALALALLVLLLRLLRAAPTGGPPAADDDAQAAASPPSMG